MVKRLIAAATGLVMFISNAAGITMASAAENDVDRYYLTSDYEYIQSRTGVEADQTDGSNNSPQIRIGASEKAVIVARVDNFSEKTCASVTYAQSGGTLGIKMTALENAEDENGTELFETTITDVAQNYKTRTTPSLVFVNPVPENAGYMKIEFTVDGSRNNESFIDYIEFSKLTMVKLKSVANDKVIDVTDAGMDNGNIIKASDSSEALSQRWEIRADNEKGWYYIVNVNSGKGIGMLSGSIDAGVTPVQWACDGSANQFWRFVEVEKEGETYYKILNKNSKLVLAINDTTVTQEIYTGEDNQLWDPVAVMGSFEYGSKYDDNYSISNISASATDGVISYKIIHTQQDGMTLKVTLSDGQEMTNAEGSFNQVANGEYTITASLYMGEEKVCEDLTKTITLTGGEYSVVGANWISSTEQNMYTDNGTIETRDVDSEEIEAIKAADSGKVWIEVDQNTRYQTMDSHPWGGCFNEIGWSVMRDLTEDQKKEIIRRLFSTDEDSLNFTAARMSVASSDFGDDMYSYADKPVKEVVNGVKYFDEEAMTDEEAMANFSIERDVVGINGDGQSMIKYIQTVLDYCPDLEIFGSPWSPPGWMKNNSKINGSDGSNNTWEETDSNYAYYAEYFVKYLDEYATLLEDKEKYAQKYPNADLSWLDRNIEIKAITPQNEVTMDTPYPSCIWTGKQLNTFIKNYLYKAITEYNEAHTDRRDVEIWHGTFTDSNKEFAMPAITDPETLQMMGAACFQWWGAPLATQVHMKYRDLKLVQSETKCGNSLNNWQYAEEQFDNFKEFLDAGISQYHLWNMILDSRGRNNAQPRVRQWPQNAPITVDGTTITYRPSYYLTKHFSSNVDAEARRVKVEGNTLRSGSVKGYVQDLRAIAFQNKDGEIVLNVKNSTSLAAPVTVIAEGKAFEVNVPAHSINTFTLNGEEFVYQDEQTSPDATEEVVIEESTDVKFTNAANNYLLSSEGYDNGTDVTTTSNQGESYQTWSLLKNENGYYRFKNFRSDLVLCVWGGSKDEGAKISQYTDTAASDQSWKLELAKTESEGDNTKYYYRIINENSQLALTALGEDDDFKVTQKKYSGTDDQLWAMTVIGGEWTHPENPIDDTKITEKTYSFISDTVNSDGWNNKGEWDYNTAPQYFYIDTVEAGKIESITLRSGYDVGSAETAVYTYDNNGEPLTQEQLKGFINNDSALNKIGSVADSKTEKWEYRTAVISADSVALTENGNDVYTVNEASSKKLDVSSIEGKKALIVGIKGNIGSKGYFDTIKIKYSEPVSDNMPEIEGISGKGVKEYSVVIDKENHTIVVPVVPGTIKENWKPEIDIAYPAAAKLTNGTWSDGTLTVSLGSESEEWSIKCVEYGNPVLDGFYADPNIACFNGKYYIYPTSDGGTSWDAPYFKCFSSDDLVNWTDEGTILDLKDVSWSNGKNGWAPTIAEKNGTYYFYYSAAPSDNGAKQLAVATSQSPTGPFVDKGIIVAGGTKAGQMIDPAVFIDDDGQAYLYWGNGGLYAAKLTDDMLHIDGEIETITPQNFREATFVIKRNNTYYFMWSNNDTGEPTYEVHYGISDSPMGPIKGDTTILSYTSAAEGSNIKATGHHSVLNIPETDEWYICYHRFNIPLYGDVTSGNSAAGNHREVCIDKMEFNADGSIKPVTPTLEGISEPVTVSAERSIQCAMNCVWNDGKIDYAATVFGAEDSEYDLYTAIYSTDGTLVKVSKNEVSGTFDAVDDTYTVKTMVWEKDGMKPLIDAQEATVTAPAPKIEISEDNVSGSASYNNNTDVNAQKVADGKIDTFFDGLSGGYVQIDLRTSYFVEKIGFAPRSNVGNAKYNTRMLDGEFYGSADGENWTSLYKVTSAPTSGMITYANINTDTAYRYIKYAVPNDEEHFCNIAEIEVYGKAVQQ